MLNRFWRNLGLYVVVFTVIATLMLALVVHTKAQQGVTLTVSPPVFELSANPGDNLTNSVRLENPTDTPRLVTVDFRNLVPYGEEGSVNLTDEPSPYSLADWLSIDSQSTTIPPKGNHVFRFSVNVPPNATPGGHFGSIVFNTKVDAPDSGQSGSKVEQEIGSLVLIKVAGDINEDVSIASFRGTKALWQGAPVELEARLENKGNIQIKPTGSVVITNIFGKQVGAVELEQKNILPEAIRRTTTTWNPKGMLIGRYTASLTVVYGGQNNTTTSTTTFWVIPYRQIIVTFGIILAIAFVSIRYRKRILAAWQALRGKN